MSMSLATAKRIHLGFTIVLLLMFFASIFSLIPEEEFADPIFRIIFNPFLLVGEILLFVWLYFNPTGLVGGFQDYIKTAVSSEARYKALYYIGVLFMFIGVVNVIRNWP